MCKQGEVIEKPALLYNRFEDLHSCQGVWRGWGYNYKPSSFLNPKPLYKEMYDWEKCKHTLYEVPCRQTQYELLGFVSSKHAQLWGRKELLHVYCLPPPRQLWGRGNNMLLPVMKKKHFKKQNSNTLNPKLRRKMKHSVNLLRLYLSFREFPFQKKAVFIS